MEEKQAGPSAELANLREWVQQLERRVGELEGDARRQRNARRRSLLFLLIAGVCYVLVFLWEMTKLS